MNFAHCEESFTIENTFSELKSKIKPPIEIKKNETIQEDEGYQRKKPTKPKKFKKKKKFSTLTNKNEEIPQGYYGSLPNIQRDFEYKQKTTSRANEIQAKIPTQEDLKDENLKKAPYDDALFLDVIVKKEKTSDYINDVQKLKFALNNLKNCIEQHSEIQRFNACVNVFDLYTKNFEEKYKDKSDCLRQSYKNILITSYNAKVLGNLMYQANYYSRFIPTQEGKYSRENINLEQQKLLNKINKTLFLIDSEA